MFRIKSTLWKYPSESGAWYFVSLSQEISTQIKSQPRPKKGWGSVRVKATIGKTTWETSIFPSKEGVYLLPIKASVRKAEDLFENETVKVLLHLP
jgi:hypothetical protein